MEHKSITLGGGVTISNTKIDNYNSDYVDFCMKCSCGGITTLMSIAQSAHITFRFGGIENPVNSIVFKCQSCGVETKLFMKQTRQEKIKDILNG